MSAVAFKCPLDYLKLKYRRCFRTVYSAVKSADSEVMYVVQLFFNQSVFLLYFATEVVFSTKSVMHMLGNPIALRIFGFMRLIFLVRMA